MSEIAVTEVYVRRFTPHTPAGGLDGCHRCRYVVDPPLGPGNLRADLWSAPTVEDRPWPTDDDGRIIITNADVTWHVLCGHSNDQGWATYEEGRPAGTYGGNGCLDQVEQDKFPCVTLWFDGDE